MKVTLLAVVSLDGKLTKGDDSKIHSWTSREDLEHYRQILADSKVIVMGSKTFEAQHPKPQEGKLFVVLTRSPERYAQKAVKGQLEFTSETPPDLLKRLETQGYTEIILNGGGQVNGAFMADKLVDELLITLEPVAFGQGTNLFGDVSFDANFELINSAKLNEKGTLLLHYIAKH